MLPIAAYGIYVGVGALFTLALSNCGGGGGGNKTEPLAPDTDDCENENTEGTRRWDSTEAANAPYTETMLAVPEDKTCEIHETSFANSSYDPSQTISSEIENYTSLHINGQTSGCEFASTRIIFGNPVNPEDPFGDDGIFSVPLSEDLENLKLYIKPNMKWGKNPIDDYEQTSGWINITLVVDNTQKTGNPEQDLYTVNIFNAGFSLEDNVWKGIGIRKEQFVWDSEASINEEGIIGDGIFDLSCHSGGLYEVVISVGCNPLETGAESSEENHCFLEANLDLLRFTDQKISPVITNPSDGEKVGQNQEEENLTVKWLKTDFNNEEINNQISYDVILEQPNWETISFNAQNNDQLKIPYYYLPTGLSSFKVQAKIEDDTSKVPTYSLPVSIESFSLTSLLNGFENNGIWFEKDEESPNEAFAVRFVQDPAESDPAENNQFSLQVTGTDENNNAYIGVAGFLVMQPIYGSNLSFFAKAPDGNSNSVRMNVYLTAVSKEDSSKETKYFGSQAIVETSNWQEYQIPLENFYETCRDGTKIEGSTIKGNYLINNPNEILGTVSVSAYPNVGGQRSFVVNLDNIRQIP